VQQFETDIYVEYQWAAPFITACGIAASTL
jgi:hypothetical protein